jgi:transcriptional regulator with XRE-family HTH domain
VATFGEQLQQQMRSAGLSLGALAQAVNYDKSYLSKVMNGHKPATRRLDEALAAQGALSALVLPVVGGIVIPPGVLTSDEVEQLTRALAEQRADTAVVSLFERLLDHHRSGGSHLLPRVLARTVPAQVRALLDLRHDAGEQVRRRLLATASQYGQFIGRMAFEAGHDADAEYWSGLALEWALAAGDTQHAAFVLMRRSTYAVDAGDPQRVIDLATAARTGPWHLSPRMVSLSRRHAAKGHAMRGNAETCRRLLDQAAELFETSHPAAEPVHVRGHSMSYLRVQAASYYLDLGWTGEAIPVLRQELATSPYARETAYSLAKLAHGHAAEHDADAAATVALEAVPMARRTGGVRAVRELRRLRDTLATARHQPAVRELFRALGTVR